MSDCYLLKKAEIHFESNNQFDYFMLISHLFIILSNISDIYMCTCVCGHVHMSADPCRGPRHQINWSWSYKQLGDAWDGCWDPNSCSLQEQHMLFTTEPFLQHPISNIQKKIKFASLVMGQDRWVNIVEMRWNFQYQSCTLSVFWQ